MPARLSKTGAILILLWMMVQNAWLSDDGYITLRVVENFVAGYGPNFNVGERVQVFTHPLWMFLLSGAYYFFRHLPLAGAISLPLYHLTIWTGLALSIVTLGLFYWKLVPNWPAAICALLALGFSRSFIHYSTSGLENPLSHLILAGFLAAVLLAPQKPWLASLLAGLGMVTRQDFLFVFAPYMAYSIAASTNRRETARQILAGLSPVILWELFSLFYYGFPVPNTAYAKLNTGLDRFSVLGSGSLYFADLWLHDRITFLVILAGIVAGFISVNRRSQALAAGVVLYLGYLIWIGGDFMSGRFFSAPLILSLGLLAAIPVPRPSIYAWAGIALLAIGFSSPHPPFLRDPRIGSEDRNIFVYKGQVTDERAYYYPRTGLLAPTKYYITRRFARPEHWVADPAEYEVRLLNDLGIKGYGAGPSVHVFDEYALSDPLLARLPAWEGGSSIGHAFRVLPAGYLETVISRENRLADPSLAQYFDRLHVVVSGPLFGPGRVLEIIRFNVGAYDSLIEEYNYRSAD